MSESIFGGGKEYQRVVGPTIPATGTPADWRAVALGTQPVINYAAIRENAAASAAAAARLRARDEEQGNPTRPAMNPKAIRRGAAASAAAAARLEKEKTTPAFISADCHL